MTAAAAPAHRPKRHWLLWGSVVVATLVLAGGVVTATKVSFHYLHAPGA